MDVIKCSYCNQHAYSKYQHTEVIVCAWCNNAVLKGNALLQNPIHRLTKPKEPFQNLIGKSFIYDRNHYKITGYIRYFYTEGYLYQWAAYNHNKLIWLCECLGNWFILFPEKNMNEIDFDRLSVRSVFTYKQQEYTIDAISAFYDYYMEGELPYFRYEYTKGITVECSNDQQLLQATIFPDNVTEIYTGRNIDFKTLQINLS